MYRVRREAAGLSQGRSLRLELSSPTATGVMLISRPVCVKQLKVEWTPPGSPDEAVTSTHADDDALLERLFARPGTVVERVVWIGPDQQEQDDWHPRMDRDFVRDEVHLLRPEHSVRLQLREPAATGTATIFYSQCAVTLRSVFKDRRTGKKKSACREYAKMRELLLDVNRLTEESMYIDKAAVGTTPKGTMPGPDFGKPVYDRALMEAPPKKPMSGLGHVRAALATLRPGQTLKLTMSSSHGPTSGMFDISIVRTDAYPGFPFVMITVRIDRQSGEAVGTWMTRYPVDVMFEQFDLYKVWTVSVIKTGGRNAAAANKTPSAGETVLYGEPVRNYYIANLEPSMPPAKWGLLDSLSEVIRRRL